MNRRLAAAGSALFFLAAPGTVAGLVPWWLTGWAVPSGSAAAPVIRAALSASVIVLGAAVLLDSFVRFVREGSGTPAPPAPTDRLVVSGWYRHVRNPMYVAVVAILLGQSLLFASPGLLVYSFLVWATMVAFVRWYEEPWLAARYGTAYADYSDHVRAWAPRLTPWRGTEHGAGDADSARPRPRSEKGPWTPS